MSICCATASHTSPAGNPRVSRDGRRVRPRNLRQPDADAARGQLREVATQLERSLPKATGVLADAEDDVTGSAVFPRHHWRKIWSTNSLEWVK